VHTLEYNRAMISQCHTPHSTVQKNLRNVMLFYQVKEAPHKMSHIVGFHLYRIDKSINIENKSPVAYS
jgi:hypothetical protein